MLQHDVITSESELSALGSKKKSKTKRVFGIIGESLLLVLFTLVLSISGQITYDYTRYSTFFVNGMSMYPTLNNTAYAIGADGTVHTGGANDSLGVLYQWKNFTNSSVTYYCDYGMFDGKGDYLKNLKRFDIVVTYFKDDMKLNSDGHYVVKSTLDNGQVPDLKIKRLIALPGETFRFDASGDLYLLNESTSKFELQSQSFLDPGIAINPDWKKQTVSQGAGKAWTSELGMTLGKDEYFVCGDNRLNSNSNDSRALGAIPGDAIQGRAVTVIGRCSFRYYSETKSEYHALWNSYKMPWQLEWL
jgi:signal peptidase I